MEVNNINPSVNNLQGLNSNIPLERTQSSSNIQESDQDSYNLSISALLKHDKSNLAIGLEESNTALAISKITLNTLEKQNTILDKIENTLENKDDNILNQEDIQNIKTLLNDFSLNTQNTKFDNKNLFTADYEENTILLSTEDDSIEIQKADLNTIVSNLKIQANDLPDTEDHFKALIKESKEIIQSYNKNFEEIESSVKEQASNSINNENKLLLENSSFKNINFANEVKDFSKTNISANIGLVAAQANIVQEQSVRLLK